jgi:hypothetical protein
MKCLYANQQANVASNEMEDHRWLVWKIMVEFNLQLKFMY